MLAENCDAGQGPQGVGDSSQHGGKSSIYFCDVFGIQAGSDLLLHIKHVWEGTPNVFSMTSANIYLELSQSQEGMETTSAG
jgi:hypothetical protein